MHGECNQWNTSTNETYKCAATLYFPPKNRCVCHILPCLLYLLTLVASLGRRRWYAPRLPLQLHIHLLTDTFFLASKFDKMGTVQVTGGRQFHRKFSDLPKFNVRMQAAKTASRLGPSFSFEIHRYSGEKANEPPGHRLHLIFLASLQCALRSA